MKNTVLVGKPKGWRPLAKLKYKREENINADLKETDDKYGPIHRAQETEQWLPLLNAVVNFLVP